MPQLQIWNAILLFEPLFGQLSALFLQAWIARESVLRALWIQSNLFKTLSTPKSFHRPFDLSNHYKMAHSLRGRFAMWFAIREGILLSEGALLQRPCLKLCSLSSLTKSQVLLDKDTHWTMSLLKWHQSVDTTNKYRLLANNFLHKLLPLAQLYYANGNQVSLWP